MGSSVKLPCLLYLCRLDLFGEFTDWQEEAGLCVWPQRRWAAGWQLDFEAEDEEGSEEKSRSCCLTSAQLALMVLQSSYATCQNKRRKPGETKCSYVSNVLLQLLNNILWIFFPPSQHQVFFYYTTQINLQRLEIACNRNSFTVNIRLPFQVRDLLVLNRKEGKEPSSNPFTGALLVVPDFNDRLFNL